MDKLKREHVVAMWLFGEAYARQRLGIVDWVADLPGRECRLIADFIEQYEKARASDQGER